MIRSEFPCKVCDGEPGHRDCIYCAGAGYIVREVNYERPAVKLLAPPPRMLEDFSRLSPNDIPTTARAFEAWGNHACVEWDGYLNEAAYNALWELRGHTPAPPNSFAKFREKYAEWFLLSEGEKLMRMHPIQFGSNNRLRHLKEARQKAASMQD